MSQDVLIRQETTSDFSKVFEVIALAFGRDSEAKLVQALRKNRQVFIPELSIVAAQNNTIVGHILFTKVAIEDSTGKSTASLALAPLAVRPAFQKTGIGAQLIRRGLKVAKDLGFKSVIVLGHANYYPRFGFKQAAQWHIHVPFKVSLNSFMAMELLENGLKDVSGTVRYPKEFETV